MKKIPKRPSIKVGMTNKRERSGALLLRCAMGSFHTPSPTGSTVVRVDCEDWIAGVIATCFDLLVDLFLVVVVLVWEKTSPRSALLSRGSCSGRGDDMVVEGVDARSNRYLLLLLLSGV